MGVIEELKQELGKYIEDIKFEVANIIIYTKDKDFFLKARLFVMPFVQKFKKRIEVRMDPDELLPKEKAEKKIREIIPKEAKIRDLFFEEKRSLVIIEVEKPRLITGDIIQRIKEETLWTPLIKRAPIKDSKVIHAIKQLLAVNSEFRRKLMNSVGERIYYSDWSKGPGYFIRGIFLGGTREVGRSAIIIQTPRSKILLDCGVSFAGNSVDSYPRFDMANIRIDELDAVIISHAHLDHVGFLPWLFRMGYDGPVYMTEPTREISALLDMDYVEVNKSEGKSEVYSLKDVREMLKHVITIPYNVVTDITPDVRLTFHNAGHIIGSALVHLNVGNGTHNILYTGDFKFGETFLLDPAQNKFQRVETLIMESTYGGSEDVTQSRDEAKEELIEIIKKTYERNGKVLIPVLGVGRAQEVALAVILGIQEGKLPSDLPIYLDGMVWDITSIHISYPEYMKKELRERILEGDNPFKYDNIIRVGKRAEREEVIYEKGPGVILATSGMLVGGPSVEYLKNLAWDKRNSLVFVSYQVRGTLGRRILDGWRELTFTEDGKLVSTKIEMEVYKVDGFSGHSNRKEIEEYLKTMEPKPKRVIIVHGEKEKSVDLAKYINKTYKIETNVPRVGDGLRLR